MQLHIGPPAGLEPAVLRYAVQDSNQLSYKETVAEL